jgi:hypothetical protein
MTGGDSSRQLPITRNEGVPGSSPGVGFRSICRIFVVSGNAPRRLSGTKWVHLRTRSRLVKGSPAWGDSAQFAGTSSPAVGSRWPHGNAPPCPRVDARDSRSLPALPTRR